MAMIIPNLAFFMHIERSKLREVRLNVTAFAYRAWNVDREGDLTE